MPWFFYPECMTRLEALEVVGAYTPDPSWSCGVEGCEDVTVWVQAQPIEGVTPTEDGQVVLQYMHTSGEGERPLYDLMGNHCRTAWIREVAPLYNDCNANPGPCYFDKEVPTTVCSATLNIPEPGGGVVNYGAIFPCNRRTECRTEVGVNEAVHGLAVWTAPVGWRVRVGADFWIDREKAVLGRATQGAWVEGKGPDVLVGYGW